MSSGEQQNPPSGLASAFRSYPVTLLCTLAAVVLFAAAWDFDYRHPGDRFGGKGRYGALTVLHFTAEPELRGLFQLWGDRWYDGDWWRLLTTGFHHGGVWHLLLNGFGMIYLGRMLEPRLGSVKFLLLFFTAIVVANLPHVAMNEAAVGISGGLYALFGLLLPLRRTDEVVAERLPEATVWLVLLWIPVGMLLTAFDVLPIANAAHLTGLIYGWIAGQALFAPRRQVRSDRLQPVDLLKAVTTNVRRWFTPRVFIASHVVLVPIALLAANPVWNARYQWFRAWQADDVSQRIDRLNVALSLNPRLGGAWRHLAGTYAKQHSDLDKWRAALQGVKNCPTDEKCIKLVNDLWFHTSPADRRRALNVLRELFPDHEADWRKQLGLFAPPARQTTTTVATVPADSGLPGFDLFWPPVDGRRVAAPQPQQAPPVDPNRPDSAALGRLL